MCMWHVGSGYRYLFAALFFSRVFYFPFSADSGVGMSSNGLACHLRGSCLCARMKVLIGRYGLKGGKM